MITRDLLPGGILNAAATLQADLIVMGANPSRSARLAAHVLWTVIHEVLRQAICPVLTLRV